MDLPRLERVVREAARAELRRVNLPVRLSSARVRMRELGADFISRTARRVLTVTGRGGRYDCLFVLVPELGEDREWWALSVLALVDLDPQAHEAAQALSTTLLAGGLARLVQSGRGWHEWPQFGRAT